jgi:hypothetical protein
MANDVQNKRWNQIHFVSPKLSINIISYIQKSKVWNYEPDVSLHSILQNSSYQEATTPYKTNGNCFGLFELRSN